MLVVKPEPAKKSIGINKARELKRFFSQRPYSSDAKITIVEDAQYLTLQAQNALLKILEEPPEYATIILEAPNKNDLIETVISRCQMMRVQNVNTDSRSAKIAVTEAANSKVWSKIKNLADAQKLDLAEKYAKQDRIKVIKAMGTWITQEREELRRSADFIGKTPKGTSDFKKSLHNLKTLNLVYKDLSNTNVNLGLALDYLLLTVE